MPVHSIQTIAGVMLSFFVATSLCYAGDAGTIGDHNSSRRFPADQVVSVTPDKGSFTIKIDTLVGSIQESIGRCKVEVIDPNKERQQLAVGKDGIVTVQNAKPGLYIVVAASDVAYGTTVIACREATQANAADDTDDLFRLDFEDESPNNTVVLMMIPVIEKQIRPVVTNNVPDFPAITRSVIDRELLANDLTTPGAENTIQLGKGGALRGKLMSVVKATSRYSGVEGTLIVVYKDGQPVGKTTANALGQFQINGLKPGAHGLVVAGRGGFAAFGIKTVDADGLIDRPLDGRKFSYTQLMNDGEVLPVVLSPPTVFPTIIQSIASIYDNVRLQAKETETMLAQKSPLDAENQKTLDAIRNDFAKQQARQPTGETTHVSPKKRSRSRIIPDANVKNSPPRVSAPRVSAPRVSAPRVAPPKVASRKQPINPLRLSPNNGSSAPFNPLRAN
jgi:hypothetical protein